MAIQKLQEKLDFGFSLKDFNEMTKILQAYMQERSDMYDKLFLHGAYTQDDMREYTHYFITPLLKDKPVHPAIYRIEHFLGREYEFFTLPEVGEIVFLLQQRISITPEDLQELEVSFEDFEYETINTIIDLWNMLYDKACNYPYLIMNSYTNDVINGVHVYYRKEFIDQDLYDLYIGFIEDINTIFPKSLKRLDSLLFVPQSYIDFTAGEGTAQFFLSDSVFAPERIKKEDKEFFLETLYHEFGHFIFALMSECSQILWYNTYNEWTEKGIKLTRDEGKNEVEECFADTFSRIYSPVHDYIQQPNEIVLETARFILEEEF
jgi:hypothetical protein